MPTIKIYLTDTEYLNFTKLTKKERIGMRRTFKNELKGDANDDN